MEYYAFDEKNARTAVEYYREYYCDKGIYENSLYVGIIELLDTLKQSGKKIVLATSKPEIFARQILKYFQIDGYFDFVAGATIDEGRTKKYEVIEYALKNLDTRQKSHVIRPY